MTTKTTLFSALFALSAYAGYAQDQQSQGQQPTDDKWSLQECVDYAYGNNITIKQSQLQARSSDVQLTQSRVAMLPTLSANGQYGFNFGRFIDPTTNQFIENNTQTGNFSLNGNLLLFQGGQVHSTIKQSRSLYQANLLDVEQSKNDVALNAALGYLQVLSNEELLAIARNQITATEAQVQRTEKLVQAGSLPQTNLLDLQAQLAIDRASFVTAQNNLNIAKLNLMQTMNLPVQDSFAIERIEVDDPSTDPYAQSVQEVYEAAIRTLPSVQSADLKVKSREYGVSAARGFYYPRLSLAGNINTYYSNSSSFGTEPFPFFDQVENNLGQFFGFGLNIPIINGLQTRSQVQQAKVQQSIAELEAQNVRVQLRQNIEQAYTAMLAAAATYASSRDQVSAFDLTFKATESRFNVGLVNSVDFNLAKVNVDRARANLVQAKYDYIFRTKILDFYQNKPLSF